MLSFLVERKKMVAREYLCPTAKENWIYFYLISCPERYSVTHPTMGQSIIRFSQSSLTNSYLNKIKTLKQKLLWCFKRQELFTDFLAHLTIPCLVKLPFVLQKSLSFVRSVFFLFGGNGAFYLPFSWLKGQGGCLLGYVKLYSEKSLRYCKYYKENV